MAKVYTYFTPEEYGHFDHGFKQVFVLDILRATSTMITALNHGTEAIYPVTSPDEAKKRKRELEKDPNVGLPVILAGERKGEKIPGFERGNSPFEYIGERDEKNIVVMTTSNGTQAIERVNRVPSVMLLANINMRSALDAVLPGENIAILCSGSHGEFSFEDSLSAGIFLSRLNLTKQYSLNDQSLFALHIAQTLFPKKQWDEKIYFDAILNGIHAKRLIQLKAEKDIEFASQFDKFSLNGKLEDFSIVRC